MEIDKKTLEYLNRWGRHEVPTAQVTTETNLSPGTHRWMATIGWMFRKDFEPFCCIQFLLISPVTFSPIGCISLSMPVTKRTELYVNTFLHVAGWDGRVWPYDGDGGWPYDSEDAAELREMLNEGTPKLGSTLTFPPKTNGSVVLSLPIHDMSKPFPLAPFMPVPKGHQDPVENLDRFRALCKDPSPFSLPN